MPTIVGTLPNNILNGQAVDATPVMADFNFIVNQVNANAMPLDTSALGLVAQGLTLNEPSNSVSTLTVNGAADANGANIKLIGNGVTTPNKTIRALNGSLSITNSAYTQQIFSIDDSGNVVALGNITSSSDERLKTDWAPLAVDFIKRLAEVKSGTYARTDSGERQAGVGAQSLKALLPEAVLGTDYLSVAYGQAALVACVELAKEVVRLRALLEPSE